MNLWTMVAIVLVLGAMLAFRRRTPSPTVFDALVPTPDCVTELPAHLLRSQR